MSARGGTYRVVLPARLDSKRLPGKMLRAVAGKPLIQWAYEQASRSGASEVIVATDDEQIRCCCEGFGAAVAMTRDDHRSGTDRIAEVATTRGWDAANVVINLQGDEPLVEPSLLDSLAASLHVHPSAAIATAAAPIEDVPSLHSTHVVKVVCDGGGRALYFSRAAIPHVRDGVTDADLLARLYRRHVGVYAYRVGALQQLAASPPSGPEVAESLEQLRALHLGMQVQVIETDAAPGHGIDVEADISRVESALWARSRAGS